MKAIFEREINAYYNGLQGYLCGAFILLFTGLFTMVINLNSGYASFEYAVSNMNFILLIVIPILTMRIISEERKQKTDQLLYSLPLSMTKIVIGKYLAMLVVILIPTAIMCLYPCILSMYGDVTLKTAFNAIGAFFMLAAALSAIGMFISSLSENQGLTAGICFICMLVLYFSADLSNYVPSNAFASLCVFAVLIALLGVVLYILIKNVMISALVSLILEAVLALFYWLSSASFEGLFSRLMSNYSVFERFYEFIYGVFDITTYIYFLSIIGVFLFLTVQSLEKRRWN